MHLRILNEERGLFDGANRDFERGRYTGRSALANSLIGSAIGGISGAAMGGVSGAFKGIAAGAVGANIGGYLASKISKYMRGSLLQLKKDIRGNRLALNYNRIYDYDDAFTKRIKTHLLKYPKIKPHIIVNISEYIQATLKLTKEESSIPNFFYFPLNSNFWIDLFNLMNSSSNIPHFIAEFVNIKLIKQYIKCRMANILDRAFPGILPNTNFIIINNGSVISIKANDYFRDESVKKYSSSYMIFYNCVDAECDKYIQFVESILNGKYRESNIDSINKAAADKAATNNANNNAVSEGIINDFKKSARKLGNMGYSVGNAMLNAAKFGGLAYLFKGDPALGAALGGAWGLAKGLWDYHTFEVDEEKAEQAIQEADKYFYKLLGNGNLIIENYDINKHLSNSSIYLTLVKICPFLNELSRKNKNNSNWTEDFINVINNSKDSIYLTTNDNKKKTLESLNNNNEYSKYHFIDSNYNILDYNTVINKLNKQGLVGGMFHPLTILAYSTDYETLTALQKQINK